MSKHNWPEVLKTARLKLGESQEQFARRFMVTTNTVSRWETGTYGLSLEAIEWVMDYALNQEVKVCPRCGGKGVVNETVGFAATPSTEAGEKPTTAELTKEKE